MAEIAPAQANCHIVSRFDKMSHLPMTKCHTMRLITICRKFTKYRRFMKCRELVGSPRWLSDEMPCLPLRFFSQAPILAAARLFSDSPHLHAALALSLRVVPRGTDYRSQ